MTPWDLVRAAHAAGVTDAPLLKAVRSVPRAEFVPAHDVASAYRDAPVPLPRGQVTTQPSLITMIRAPYDAGIVRAAFPRVPEPLVDQLRAGGGLVQPIGHGGQACVELYERRARGPVHRRTVTATRFVRLYGAHGWGRRCRAQR